MSKGYHEPQASREGSCDWITPRVLSYDEEACTRAR